MSQALRLRIEGPPSRISAEALARALTESLAILANIGRAVTSRPQRSHSPLTWYITKLESSSATAVLEAESTASDVDQDTVDLVGNEYVDGLRAVESGTALPRFSDRDLSRSPEPHSAAAQSTFRRIP